MNASTLRRLAVLGYLGLIGGFLTTPSLALTLISETRSVTASYYGGGVETISSPGTFGTFSAFASGTPFGGGSVSVGQISNITASGFDLRHSAVDDYGPGGVAESIFQFKFSLAQDTRIIISGYSNYYSGNATLVSASLGPIPLIWGPAQSFYRNYLDFDQVLGSGVYTFTATERIRDGVGTVFSTTLSLREVPDGGPSAWFLGLGMLMLAAIRRKLA